MNNLWTHEISRSPLIAIVEESKIHVGYTELAEIHMKVRFQSPNELVRIDKPGKSAPGSSGRLRFGRSSLGTSRKDMPEDSMAVELTFSM